jgi:endonuclease/exonuclease/phosphatase family metal-dependent hydrolase
VHRVTSYNIRKAIGTDRLRRPERILDVIGELSPTIVVLQEADRRFRARQSALPLALVEAARFHAVPFDTRPDSIGWHGNAILVRDDVRVTDHALIPLPTLEPRGAVMAELKIGKNALRVVGMHLDLSGLWRRKQIRAILHSLTQRTPMPTILAGDLNEWSPHGGCLREFAEGFRIAHSTPSYHSQRPVARLDRIMIGSGLHFSGSGTHQSVHTKRASDHLPVWADFEFD